MQKRRREGEVEVGDEVPAGAGGDGCVDGCGSEACQARVYDAERRAVTAETQLNNLYAELQEERKKASGLERRTAAAAARASRDQRLIQNLRKQNEALKSAATVHFTFTFEDGGSESSRAIEDGADGGDGGGARADGGADVCDGDGDEARDVGGGDDGARDGDDGPGPRPGLQPLPGRA